MYTLNADGKFIITGRLQLIIMVAAENVRAIIYIFMEQTIYVYTVSVMAARR